MKLQLGETFQVWVVESSEEHVNIEWNVFWKTCLSSVKLPSLGVRPNEIENAESLRLRLSVSRSVFVHLVVGFMDDALDDLPYIELLLNGPLEEVKSSLSFLKPVIVEQIEEPFLLQC